MTGERLTELRGILNLTQAAFGRLFHVEIRSIRRWENESDKYPVPVSIAIALELMVHYRCKPARAYKMATGKDFEE